MDALLSPAPFLSVPLERRRAPRRPAGGEAMAIFSTGVGVGALTSVTLLDSSRTGIAVRSRTEVAPGACVSLVPREATWPRQIGIVVRCEPDGDGGFRLGLRSRAGVVAA